MNKLKNKNIKKIRIKMENSDHKHVIFIHYFNLSVFSVRHKNC